MLNNISNIASVIKTENVKLQSIKIPKALPRLNSFVKLEVLENINNTTKILINGSLFQSKLPIKVKVGDILFAQLISYNPVTISLNSFSSAKLSSEVLLGLIFNKLGLKKTDIAEKFVKFLLKTKKTLSKEKIEEAIDVISSNDMSPDEIRFAFISAYFWDENNETYKRKKIIYDRIFDVSFNELCDLIFKSIVRISSFNLDNYFYSELKEKLFFDYDNFESNASMSGLFGKVKNSIEFAEYIEDYINKNILPQNAISELNRLREYLIKYVLQKSLLNKYKLFYDFAITLNKEGLHLWKYRATEINNANGERVVKLNSLLKVKNQEINTEIFVTRNKIQGRIISEGRRDKSIIINTDKLNNQISKRLSVETRIDSSESVNF